MDTSYSLALFSNEDKFITFGQKKRCQYGSEVFADSL